MGLTTREIGSSSFNDMISSIDRRSEFVENRAGANVTTNNALISYGLSNSCSILNAPCGYSNGVYPSLTPIKTFGSELVTNGTFDTDSDWLKTNAVIANGKATITVVGGAYSVIRQALFTYVSGRSYVLEAEVQGTSGKACTFFDNGANIGGLTTSNGVINFDGSAQKVYIEWTANANSDAIICARNGSGDFSFSIDNVSVKEVTEADFDFTRGSSATRVNELGLVQDVQLLSGELVQNGNFEQIGSELVTNGGFDTNTGWTKGSGWSIANGSLNGVNATSSTYQNNGLISGKFYKVVYEVSNYSSGTVQIKLGGTLGEARNENGTYTEYIKASQVITWIVGTNFSGSIDNVSVKEVGQNWTLEGGWSVEDGLLVNDGTGVNLSATQSGFFTVGNKYRVSLDVKSITQGSLEIYLGFPQSDVKTINSIGSYTYDIIASGNTTFYIKPLSNFTGSIDNVSVIEVTDDTDLPRINYTNFDYEDVLGDELVNYDNFNYGSGGWSLVGSKWVFDDVTNGYLVIDNIDVEVGQKYQVTVNISISSGDANFRITSGNGQTQLFNYTDFSDGETTFETTVAGVDGTLQRLFAVTSLTDNPFTLNSISVKELTEDVVVPYSGEGSLLLENQSTNLYTDSNNFLSWSVGGSLTLTPNYTISPSGENNATRLQWGSGTNFLYKSLSHVGNNFTNSFYIKSNTSENQYLKLFLDNGAQSQEKTITPQWQRFTLTNVATPTQSNRNAGLIRSSNQVGDLDVSIAFSQFEALSYATSYIPTNGSTVTRLADVCNNAGNSDLINSTEGVLYAEISALANDGTNRAIAISDGTTSNVVRFYYSVTDNRIVGNVKSVGTTVFNYNNVLTDATDFLKIAVSYKANDFKMYVNGTEVSTDTSGNVPIGLNELAFDNGAGNDDFYGNVKCVAVFKEALSDTELEKLTTI